MADYIDGFVIPVPKKKLAAYRRFARKYDPIWMEYGALAVYEYVGDDVKPGKLTSFPQAVILKKDEVVVFSWIVYKSRRDRDRINALVMKDRRFAGVPPKNMPFDGKRLIMGGFKSLLALRAK